ncbi:MAG TPA: hypothetical protein VK988_05845 [Acidimicrobiales bacterium]|nr:hypothetical protein [Acidimicrobiales bacterium]
MSDEEQDLEEVFAQIEETRRVIFQLRGEYLSLMNSLEGMLDRIIVLYFGQDWPAKEFRSWLLGRIQTSSKIDIIGELLRSVGLHQFAPRYLQALREANAFRNDVAHSAVDVDTDALQPGPNGTCDESLLDNMLHPSAIRTSRSGVSVNRVDLDDVKSRLHRLGTVLAWTMHLYIGVLAYKDGRDPLLSVSRVAEANPNTPRMV